MVSARVLFVNHTSTVSGAEKVLLDVASERTGSSAFLFEEGDLNRSMAARGVNVISSRFGGGLTRLTRDCRPSHVLPLSGKLSAVLAELSVAARRHEVIYTNSQKAFVLGALAAGITRRPLIWHLHDIISDDHFGASHRRLQTALANRFAKAVVGPSRAVTSAFVAQGGRADLVHVVPNGVEVQAEQASRGDLRRSLGLPAGPLIGVFSRLAPWKGQHVVLRALAQLPAVKCIIAGGSLFGEDEYARSLNTLVENLGISDRVTFLGQRRDVPRLMQAVDMVVHPSVSPEPFALTLLEAMLLRTPIVATDTGGSSEALAGGDAGTLVPPGDTAALVSAIRTVLDQPTQMARQVERAHARAQQEYCVARMRKGIAEVIDSVAAGTSA